MRSKITLAWAWLWLVLPGVHSAPLSAAEPLPSYNVDLKETSVSGVSSGAYMAGQFHVAYSGTVKGAGIVAGGPYFCAQGLLSNAFTQCMRTILGDPDPAELFAIAQELSAAGRIDDLANLADDKVYLFAGTLDDTVEPAVVASARAFYELAGVPAGNLLISSDLPAGHALVTADFGNACDSTGPPFINDCDYDQAGAILKHIYGEDDLVVPGPEARGSLIRFDQSEFLGDPNRHGLNELGYAYVPNACAEGEACRVHVAFHGCRQTTADIKDLFPAQAGFNDWARGNDIIVLYPQAWATGGNPKGCWDWWGFGGDDYHTKAGRQMAAVKAMLDRLAGAEGPVGAYCQRHEDSNYQHWLAGRARVCRFWLVCAQGSGESLGTMYGSSTLYEQPQGNFSTQSCQ